uniref:Uncharacterized protein n=1 Tax=Arundo donax TaxID=35708 RepID=A0A0A9B6J1_ARUDO
MRMSRRTAR